MPSSLLIPNSTFASAIKVLGRSSQTVANAATARIDGSFDPIKGSYLRDGFVSEGEMYMFEENTRSAGQGLSGPEKRLGDAARILDLAVYGTNAARLEVQVNTPRANLQKEVPIAGMTGNLELRNSFDNTLVLSGDRKKLAQRIAGAGQSTIGPDDFQKALPYLTPNECYLANELFNELYFSKPLGTFTQDSLTPGGRHLSLETTQSGQGKVPTGGYHPAADGRVTYTIDYAFSAELTLKSRELLINTKTGEVFTPDANHKVRIPVANGAELAVVTRGATGKVKEKFTLMIAGGDQEHGSY